MAAKPELIVLWAKVLNEARDQYILIKDDIIVDVFDCCGLDGLKENLFIMESEETIVINLTSSTLLPGLIDLHVHPEICEDSYQIDFLTTSSASKTLRAFHALQDLLWNGWTTVRVAGCADPGYSIWDIKQAFIQWENHRHTSKQITIKSCLCAGSAACEGGSPHFSGGKAQRYYASAWGPRIFGAGHYFSITGGCGDINQLNPSFTTIPCNNSRCLADGRLVDGVDEMRKAIREEIKFGSDWIKLLVTGGYMSAGTNNIGSVDASHYSFEEIQFCVQEASRFGVNVMAHAHGARGIKDAIKAGCRSIEHASFIDDEAVELMIQYNCYLVPTLYIGLYFDLKLPEAEQLSKMMKLNKERGAETDRCIANAIKAGVKFAFGTDYVGWPGNESAIEFQLLVERGMSNLDAINSAGPVAAECLRKENELGKISKLFKADIIAVGSDPLVNIKAMRDVQFVMKDGIIIRHCLSRHPIVAHWKKVRERQ